MIQKKANGKESFPFSKRQMSLIIILLGFLLLLVLIWLWYDLKLKALNYGIKATPENSFIQTK